MKNHNGIYVKNQQQIEGIRKACRITSQLLDLVDTLTLDGITTAEIDEFLAEKMKEFGVKSAALNYRGFPKSVCVSPNEVVCHGVPKDTRLKYGDIVNVDVAIVANGYYGDSSRTYIVGKVDEQIQRLVADAKGAMLAGVEAVRAKGRIGDVGAAIQRYVKESGYDYGIVREYTGHGVGIAFHEAPFVVNVSKKDTGARLVPGMIFTVEPMLNLGVAETEVDPVDKWTVRTKDRALSAQWEHTVLVTREGFEILTVSE